MKNYYQVLKLNGLFDNIAENELEQMLNCLSAKVIAYQKDSVIFLAGDEIPKVGIVLSNSVQVIKEDYSGNRSILAELSAGDIFGETFACAGITKSPVTVLTMAGCEVLFIDYKKIVSTCSSACVFHTKLIENMLKLLADKNLVLHQKIEFISKRTTREKLLSYFSAQMKRSQANRFTVPFSRSELADYLCVDRSAMSRELCKMRDEGMLKFKGSFFEMLTLSR